MALIKCPECGKEISDTAKVCPHCGYKKPLKNPLNVFFYTHPRILGVILAVIILGIFYWLVSKGIFNDKETREMFKRADQVIERSEETIKETEDILNQYSFEN